MIKQVKTIIFMINFVEKLEYNCIIIYKTIHNFIPGEQKIIIFLKKNSTILLESNCF